MIETSLPADVVDRVLDACAAELASPELQRVASAIGQLGTTESESVWMVRQVSEIPGSQHAILRLMSQLAAAGFENHGAALERLLLFRTARHSLPDLPALPVCSSVK